MNLRDKSIIEEIGSSKFVKLSDAKLVEKELSDK